MRYQHRTNPRLVAYTSDQALRFEGDRYRGRAIIAVTIHALGRTGQTASEMSRPMFRRIFRLDLTKR